MLDNDTIFVADNKITSQNDFHVMMGSIDQTNEIFLNSRGKQCTPISCVAITYFYKKNIDAWNSNDIDYILRTGDQLYKTSKNILNQKNVSFDYLTFDEVYNTVHLHGDTFQFFENIETHSCNGNIKHIEQGICTENNLITSLSSFFEINKYTTGIFTCNNYTFAVM